MCVCVCALVCTYNDLSFTSSSNVQWTCTLTPTSVRQFDHPTGPTVPIPCSALGIFSLFFTEDLWCTIVDQTNLYAKQCMGEEKYAVWEKVTVEDMKAFYGFNILMGVIRLPTLHDYWKCDDHFHYAPIASRISRDRFFELRRYLHFVDNSTLASPGSEGYDKLGKVWPLINAVVSKCQSLYNVHRDVSVDEAMIKFKGRSSLKQYLPVKRGFKVWCMADSTNGYISNFEVYTGKGETTEHALGARVVKKLTQPLQKK